MDDLPGFVRRLPAALDGLVDLALDLRWSWNHASDELWRQLDEETWERTGNPWVLLQNLASARLEEAANDRAFLDELHDVVAQRDEYLTDCGCLRSTHDEAGVRTVAYFSLEFGLCEALPLYAGGLGVLAGDHLKTASDLGVPLVGVGLLYQEGYFRQLVDRDGRQVEAYPYNEPSSLPLRIARDPSGTPVRVVVELPGRDVRLRAWEARVGRTSLYLLDSNDPVNAPIDRGITSKLYGGGPEMRLLQELVLGIGGWRLLHALGVAVDVCHLNEGHAAFVVLERARQHAEATGLSFREALWATRVGNVFTTHTPLRAAFDTFPVSLLAKYLPPHGGYLPSLGIPFAELLALGRKDGGNEAEPFNLAYLAMRGCGAANGVSRLHGEVSRRLFRELFPHWPEREVPVGHVTNGVHVSSWDSPWADRLWTRTCGKDRWRGTVESLADAVGELSDEEIWTVASRERADLVDYARDRLAAQLAQRGMPPDEVERIGEVLDPNVLTVGFARRFTEYKRPNMLLHDPERLARLVNDGARPLQLVVAGKAHPADAEGKRLVREWFDFVARTDVRQRAVFLEDYDMLLAKELVQGVDLWLNTPRRPWEACGTSGMKVLVNGGLNVSELDGWWAEAYCPECGWALGDGREHEEPGWDAREARDLYRLLEDEIVPAFYDRDAQGIPKAWVDRVRSSMARLGPRFSSNRMMGEYVDEYYVPAARAVKERTAGDGRLARELHAWQSAVAMHWQEVHFSHVEVQPADGGWRFDVHVHLGALAPDAVRVELCADPNATHGAARVPLERGGEIPGTVHGYVYGGTVETDRPAEHFTPRVIAWHDAARVPAEAPYVRWQH